MNSGINSKGRMFLGAATAAELMTSSPHSISDKATVKEAIAFLTARGFSAAPVIDEAGRPVGVLSRADILVHDREAPRQATPAYYHAEQLESSGKRAAAAAPERTRVRDIMTPVVFSVNPSTPSAKVVEHMTGLKVHRLFVVDELGVLVGVISIVDILSHLLPE